MRWRLLCVDCIFDIWQDKFQSLQHEKPAAAAAAAALRAVYANPNFIEFLQSVSGISKLLPDLASDRGALPTTSIIGIPPGGFLALHRDFNRHPGTGLHLRVNVLLYLNDDWEEEYGGLFELCDSGTCLVILLLLLVPHPELSANPRRHP